VNTIIAQATEKDQLRLDLLLSFSVLNVITQAYAGCIEKVYGDTYALEREVIPDAHALASVIDSCGKSGRGELGASLCLRYARETGTAWETLRKHHLNVIAAIRDMRVNLPADRGIYEIGDASIASDVSDMLACCSASSTPIAVVAREGEICRISARIPPGIDADLGTAIRVLAQSCGGHGGGHRYRAGATIPCMRLDEFRKDWQEVVAA
jgi:hypothetical protein